MTDNEEIIIELASVRTNVCEHCGKAIDDAPKKSEITYRNHKDQNIRMSYIAHTHCERGFTRLNEQIRLITEGEPEDIRMSWGKMCGGNK